MSTRSHLTFVDRLAERIRFDSLGFLGFALIGCIAIVAAKILAAPPIWVAVGAVLVMVAYAVMVRFTETGRLRSDQAGDNCYYLGLIFTLASLAYAIFTFDPNDTATTIIQGFGIALATTIAGLVLRVFFSQTRADLIDIEDRTRLELTEAAGVLKTSLTQVTVSLNDFSRQTRQSLDEARQELVALVEAAVEEGTRGIETMSRHAIETLGAEYATLGERTKRVNAGLARVATSLEAQATTIEIFATTTGKASRRLDTFAGGSSSVDQALATIAEHAHSVANAQAALIADAAALHGLVERYAQLEDGTRRAIATATQSMVDVGKNLRAEVEMLTGLHQQAMQDLAEQVGAATTAISHHNGALEAELARSRGDVAKVHGALVELTGTLANHVEKLTPA